MEVRQLSDPTDGDWLELRGMLWDDTERSEHEAEMVQIVAEPSRFVVFLAVASGGRSAGFAEVSVRTDYVNGCDSSPVAFLEGIYVRPEFRRRGVARLLCEAAQRWGRSRDCAELASDAHIDNTVSRSMHLGLGFQETERVVYFRKYV